MTPASSAQALPPAYWGKPSGLGCLDRVVADVFREGYSHHITRLMVLGNLATLLDVSPRALTDWFWFAYVDAYDWVVEPNVLAMATYGAGDLMTTKPYISGSAYLDRMSDYCASCRFDPKSTCPVTRLYWAFLGRHEAQLAGNQRIAMPLRSLAKRSPEERARDARVFEWVSHALEQRRRGYARAMVGQLGTPDPGLEAAVRCRPEPALSSLDVSRRCARLGSDRRSLYPSDARASPRVREGGTREGCAGRQSRVLAG